MNGGQQFWFGWGSSHTRTEKVRFLGRPTLTQYQHHFLVASLCVPIPLPSSYAERISITSKILFIQVLTLVMLARFAIFDTV